MCSILKYAGREKVVEGEGAPTLSMDFATAFTRPASTTLTASEFSAAGLRPPPASGGGRRRAMPGTGLPDGGAGCRGPASSESELRGSAAWRVAANFASTCSRDWPWGRSDAVAEAITSTTSDTSSIAQQYKS